MTAPLAVIVVLLGRAMLASVLASPDSAAPAVSPGSLRDEDLTALVVDRHDEWNGDLDLTRVWVRLAGPSMANRNRNPLNVKYGSDTRRYVDGGVAALSPVTPLDGGHFLKFESSVAGFRAAVDLLNTPRYSGLPLDGALRRWSNNGYGAEILARTSLSGQKTMPSLGREEISMLLRAMATAEGYRSSALTDEITQALAAQP